MKTFFKILIAVTLFPALIHSGEMRFPLVNSEQSRTFASSIGCAGTSVSVDGGTLYVDCANNFVGIGTTAPAYPLDVTGDIRTSSQLITVGSATVQGSAFSVGGSTLSVAAGVVSIGGTGATTRNSVIRLNSSNNFITVVATAAASTSLGFLGYGSAAPHAPGTPVLTWTDGGRVGIGVSAPTSILHVDKGTGVGQATLDGSTGGCIMLRDTDDAGWTECDALDGTLSCTVDADGACD